MSKLRGRALLPSKFVFRHALPAFLASPRYWRMAPQQLRKYFEVMDPEKDVGVSQIALRCNEVCNLRCSTCGQWGENGWILEKLNRGERLDSLSWETTRRVVYETLHDRPIYYVWGGEPSMWKPLVPLFQELGKNNLLGTIVSNCHVLEPLVEPLVDTGAVSVLFVSLDGWDAQSQNTIRQPAGNKPGDNFERTMRCIDKIDAYKRQQRVSFPFIVPITVVSNYNYRHLVEIHELVREKTQLHPYYYGWFITEERAQAHEAVFEERFGFKPHNHRGYIKSIFNEVDPAVVAEQVARVLESSKGYPSVPNFLPDIYSEADIRRYYADHSWTAGYDFCHSIYNAIEISPDGRVTPCRDYQDYECGNVDEQPFYEVWNGEKFKKFRREMKKGLMPVCTRCCGLQGF